MKFHSPRCDPLHFDYQLNGSSIKVKSSCKDLGVIFCSDLSWSNHIGTILSKAYKTLYFIKRTFAISSPMRVKKLLYLSLVLPLVTYCSQVWRPHLRKDIIALEKLQKRATKYIVNDKSLNYKQRLISLKLLPLMYRLEVNDLLFFISSLKNPADHFDILNFVSLNCKITRAGSNFKLVHRSTINNLDKNSYFSRLPRLWNSFPTINPDSSISSIKLLINNHMFNHFSSHFNSDNFCTYQYLCPCHLCSVLPVSSYIR